MKPILRFPALPVVAGMVLLLALTGRAELSDDEKKALFRKSSSGGEESRSQSHHSKKAKHPSPSPTPHHSSHQSDHGTDRKSGHKSHHDSDHNSGHKSSHRSDEGKRKSPHHHQEEVPVSHHEHHGSTVEKASAASREQSPKASNAPVQTPLTPLSPQSSDTAPTPLTPLSPQSSEPSQSVPDTSSSGHKKSASSPSPLPLPHGATPSAPITIEKSGAETAQGLEPAPSSLQQEGFWGKVFGPHRSYSYLNSSTRAAIDRAPVRRGRWKYIVVHNSGTREGNARVFNIYHLRVRHMKNGLAYHFVIGDGHGSGDGQIEIGHRWTAQLNGGHVASDYLNDIALGICLVGDFNRDLPTRAQIGALEELVGYLRERVGKSQGRRAIVYAHKEINPRPTDCPGDHFPYSWLHAKFGNAR